MRDLYARCIPAISSFEDKIKILRDELARYQEILVRFDQLIIEKAGRAQLDEFKVHVRNTYLMTSEIYDF